MAINFPPGPHEIGDTYTEDGLTWEWNGVKWIPVGGGGGGGDQLWQSADNILRPATAGDGVAVLNPTQGSFSVGQDVDGSGTNHLGVWYGTGGGGAASADIFTSNGDLRFNVDGNGVATGGQISFGRAFGDPQMTLDADGRLLVGPATNTSDVRAIFEGNPGGNPGAVVIQRGGAFPNSNQAIGNLYFTSAAGGTGATIDVNADADWSDTSTPSRLQLSTTPTGSTTQEERLRINQAGAFGLAGANFGDAGQVLTSQGNAAAPQWATLAEVQSISGTGTLGNLQNLPNWDLGQSSYRVNRVGNQLTLAVTLLNPSNGGELRDGGSLDLSAYPAGIPGFNRVSGVVNIYESGSNLTAPNNPIVAQLLNRTVLFRTGQDRTGLNMVLVSFVDIVP